MVVDVNCELFNAKLNDKIVVALAKSLSLSGAPDDGKYNPKKEPSIADGYDYVMHGRVFSIKHVQNQQIEVQASFGGLLFKIIGEQSRLESFEMDMQFYILMRYSGESADAMDM
jgi:DNA-directed RNA polymerases I, II, and III subunit RPABC3